MLTRRDLLKSAAVTGLLGVVPSVAGATLNPIDLLPAENANYLRQAIKDLRQKLLKEDRVVRWDFAAAPGDTIREKHHSLIATMKFLDSEISSSLHVVLGERFQRIYAGPEIGSIFETANWFCATSSEQYSKDMKEIEKRIEDSCRFYQKYPSKEYQKVLYDLLHTPMKTGLVADRWTLYKDILYPVSELMLAAEDLQDGILVKITNFM